MLHHAVQRWRKSGDLSPRIEVSILESSIEESSPPIVPKPKRARSNFIMDDVEVSGDDQSMGDEDSLMDFMDADGHHWIINHWMCLLISIELLITNNSTSIHR